MHYKFFVIIKKPILSIKEIVAFTLAEVLITLTVVGVLAAMTVPGLMQATQEQELKTGWKKAYADIAHASLKIMDDNGGNLYDTTITDAAALGIAITDEYLGYLNYRKKCIDAGTCWHGGAGTWKWLDGTPEDWYGGPAMSAILNNGNLLFFYGHYIGVDVNGKKGPNTNGRDIFWIHLSLNSITPFGANDGFETDCKPPSGRGMGCAAKYLMQ